MRGNANNMQKRKMDSDHNDELDGQKHQKNHTDGITNLNTNKICIQRTRRVEFPIEMYSLLRLHFQTLLNSPSFSTKRVLGRVEWEIERNPEEINNLVSPKPPAKQFQHLTMCLQQIYGIPAFCYGQTKNSETDYVLHATNPAKHQPISIHVGFLSELDTYIMKNAANISSQHPNTWEIENATFVRLHSHRGGLEYLPNFVQSKICGLIKKGLKLENIRLQTEKLCIFGQGGYFKPGPLDSNSDKIGTLLVFFPSQHEGAGITIQQEEYSNSISTVSTDDFPWVAFHDSCGFSMDPVQSGNCVAVVCSIELEKDGLDTSLQLARYEEISSSRMTIGPPSLHLQEEALQRVANVILGQPNTIIGIVLDKKYRTSNLKNSDLEGNDRLLFETLKSAGFSMEIKSLLYLSSLESMMVSSTKTIISWMQEDMEAAMQSDVAPIEIHHGIPFFRVGSLGTRFDYDNTSRVQKSLYWTAGLIVTKPTWWTYARLLWVAKLKNSPQECVIAKLPHELIKVIFCMVHDMLKEAPTTPLQFSVGPWKH